MLKFDEKRCPRCAETIKKVAAVCRHCGHTFSDTDVAAAQSEVRLGQIATFVITAALVAGAVYWFNSISSKTPPSPSEVAQTAAKDAEDKKYGLHCLSQWDGSHKGVVGELKASLRNPESFHHVSTKMGAVTAAGENMLIMEYRAENGFGGMNAGKLMASVKNSDCTFEVLLNADE